MKSTEGLFRIWTYNRGMTEKPTRSTYLEVDLGQLRQNLLNIRRQVLRQRSWCLLKANAYGHGVDGVAPYIASLVDYIGVAIVDEGVQLRRMGIATPIIVLGGTLAEELPRFLIRHELTVSASSLELLGGGRRRPEGRRRLKVISRSTRAWNGLECTTMRRRHFLERSLECATSTSKAYSRTWPTPRSADLSHARLQLEDSTRCWPSMSTKAFATAASSHGQLRSDLCSYRKATWTWFVQA